MPRDKAIKNFVIWSILEASAIIDIDETNVLSVYVLPEICIGCIPA